jgi:hypothetical protein
MCLSAQRLPLQPVRKHPGPSGGGKGGKIVLVVVLVVVVVLGDVVFVGQPSSGSGRHAIRARVGRAPRAVARTSVRRPVGVTGRSVTQSSGEANAPPGGSRTSVATRARRREGVVRQPSAQS